MSFCQPHINLVQGTKIPKTRDLVVAAKPSRTSASLWRIDRERHGKLSGCCAHCLFVAKGTSTSCGVLSHLNALRQILFLAEGVVPHSARAGSTGLPTIRHSVKFPERLVGEKRSAGGQLAASEYSSWAPASTRHRSHFCRILQNGVQPSLP